MRRRLTEYIRKPDTLDTHAIAALRDDRAAAEQIERRIRGDEDAGGGAVGDAGRFAGVAALHRKRHAGLDVDRHRPAGRDAERRLPRITRERAARAYVVDDIVLEVARRRKLDAVREARLGRQGKKGRKGQERRKGQEIAGGFHGFPFNLSTFQPFNRQRAVPKAVALTVRAAPDAPCTWHPFGSSTEKAPSSFS